MKLTSAELRKQLRETEEAEREAARKAYEAIKIEYDYSVVQKSEHVFVIQRRIREDVWKKLLWAKEQHPDVPHYREYRWEGMEYLLIGNYLAAVCGGHLILKATPDGSDTFSHEPRLLAHEERDAILRGEVPDSLKME